MANRTGNTTEAAGALGKHLAKHRTANGQDLAQSGRAGFCCGQQGIASAMLPPISDISAVGASSVTIAPRVVIIGPVRRLTTAMIESKRGMSDQSCISGLSHIVRLEKRGRRVSFAGIRGFAVTRSGGLGDDLFLCFQN
jgi:hypothetical protein